VACKEIGLEVDGDKIKYIFMSEDKNAGRSSSKMFEIIWFEIVEEFKYLVKKNFNKSILYSPTNQEQIEIRQCLLSFVAESLVFKFSIQKLEDSEL